MALTFGCSTPLPTLETTIPEAEVPKVVVESFRREYPQAVIKSCARELKGHSTFYEIVTDGRSVPHTVIFTPDGKLAETEVEIPFTQLPASVQEAVKIAQKKGRPAVYELEIEEGNHVVDYVFDMTGRRIQQKGD